MYATDKARAVPQKSLHQETYLRKSTQEANRRPVQRVQSEDVPNTYRSQVIWHLLVIHESVLFKFHVSDIYWSVNSVCFVWLCVCLRNSLRWLTWRMTLMGAGILSGGSRQSCLHAQTQRWLSGKHLLSSWPYEVILVGVENNCCTAFVSYSD